MIRFLGVLVALCLLSTALTAVPSTCKNKITAGVIMLKYLGKPMNVSVVSGNEYWITMSNDGTGVKMEHNANIRFATGCYEKWDPDMYFTFNPVGKTVAWSSNINGKGCGCNTGPFLAALPGLDKNGKPNPGKHGEYMCDANSEVNCPEFDLVEFNEVAVQTTAHICTTTDGSYYSKCDGGGCHINPPHTNTSQTQYGPGSKYTIDTTKDFRTAVSFHQDSSGKLTEVVSVMTQQGKSITMVLSQEHCAKNVTHQADYLGTMGKQMASHGMSIVVDWWGTQAWNMRWLDAPPCSAHNGNCDTSGTVNYYDFEISQASQGPEGGPRFS